MMRSETMVDAVYTLRGESVVEDHALLLWQALSQHFPWLAEESEAAVLPLAGLARGIGVRYVGGRTRLVIRLPRRRLASAEFVTGAQLDLGGVLEVGGLKPREITSSRVVHSPCVDLDTRDEVEFQDRCREQLVARGMSAEIVCGRGRQLQGETGSVYGYSVMLHGLNEAQTLALQERGLGGNRHLGCGTFVPHKNVAAVGGE